MLVSLYKGTFGRFSEPKGKRTYRPRINSHTIILIPHPRPLDLHLTALSNIKRIRIPASFTRVPIPIRRRVINHHIRQGQILTPIDTKHVNRRIHNSNALNHRINQFMHLKILWFGNGTVLA